LSNHPIEALMRTAMESIKEMVDVNTIVGEPVETPDGAVVIPVTKVLCGFAAGGGDYSLTNTEQSSNNQKNDQLPFGGGSGAGVSVQPVGFLVVGNEDVKLLPVDGGTAVDRLIDLTPRVLNQIQEAWQNSKMAKGKSNEKQKTEETPIN
jgi:sporulation protein YtfJ